MRFVLIAVGVVTLIVGALVFFAPSREPLPGSLIGPPSLSPDGRLIAFTYGRSVGDNALLLYDIESEQLRLIDKPPYLFVRWPSFSPDGERLAVATYCDEECPPEASNYQIAVVNLNTEEMEFVTSGRDFVRKGPVFSSDGRTVFFTASELDWHEDWIATGRRWPDDWGESRSAAFDGLSKVMLIDEQEVQLFPSAQNPLSFFSCKVGAVTDRGDVYFSAIGPRGGGGLATTEIDRKTSMLGYVLRSNGELELLAQNIDWPMSSISSSVDGKTQIFISSPATDRYKYDLFQLADGMVSQISFLGTHMSFARVSADGQTVVFVADVRRQRNWSIWIHDMVTGETKMTLSYEKIREFLGISPEAE